MTNLKTALHDLHIELGARMVAFAGYDMPVHYSSGIIKEHLHCRTLAGFFDISHMGQCVISGDDIATELEKLTPSNVSKLAINQQLYTVLTNENGGVIDDIIITRLASKFMLIVNAACKDKDYQHLNAFLPESCQLQPLTDYALFALQGPAAIDVMQHLSKPACQLSFMQALETQINGIDCIVSRCGYTGEDGFEISVANTDAQTLARLLLSFDSVMPIGLGARDTLRLEAGLSLYGHELNETLTLLDSGLAWLIHHRTNYPGAEKIHDQLEHGADKQKIGLVIDGKIPVRENTPIIDINNNVVGVITSGSFSPSLQRPIALASIDSNNSNDSFYAQVRNRTITLHKAALPFIKHRYHRR
ncbi:MAG: glycine cleavage system aminomethyltransferase GcvT [Gammaproteobacteria bacterium]|nr:glycine cleavage system aminomethyltransferase GcvT [Gammaproteobacteria bacterium]